MTTRIDEEEVHPTIRELIINSLGIAKYEKFLKRELILAKLVIPFDGMSFSDFDAISNTDQNIICLWKQIDVNEPTMFAGQPMQGDHPTLFNAKTWSNMLQSKELILSFFQSKRMLRIV